MSNHNNNDHQVQVIDRCNQDMQQLISGIFDLCKWSAVCLGSGMIVTASSLISAFGGMLYLYNIGITITGSAIIAYALFALIDSCNSAVNHCQEAYQDIDQLIAIINNDISISGDVDDNDDVANMPNAS